MFENIVPQAARQQLSEFVGQTLGLHFPPERFMELERGLLATAEELGFADVHACTHRLLGATPGERLVETLASHLTVGETYFFRDKKTFDILAESLLPELIRIRRDNGRRLRFWSAACCTGEEAYSLAILLHQTIPDLADWNVSILATDINQRFLKKAATGIYGEWSFRESPPWFKDRYFHRIDSGRYEISPEIKKRVTFAHFNLVEDTYPTLATDTNAMDVIFCRNVLMYFTPAQAAKVVRMLRRSLVDGGWLVVSACETSHALFSDFAPANFPGIILYQKSDETRRIAPAWTPPAREPIALAPPAMTILKPPAPKKRPVQKLIMPPITPTPMDTASELHRQGRYAEAADTLIKFIDNGGAAGPGAFSLLARALANQGRLADALSWCEGWLAADKMNASAHYLRAVVVQELGDATGARRSLQRAIYLQPGFVLAHFALGNLARAGGRKRESAKHFDNALRLLKSIDTGELLPEADGLTAGRLAEIISSISAEETAR